MSEVNQQNPISNNILAKVAGGVVGLIPLGILWGQVDAWANQEPGRAEREIARLDQRIEAEAAAADEAEYNLERLRVNIGEGCVALVSSYFPGQVLAETPEDTIVADINAGSNVSCGEDPVEIRTNVRSLFVANEAAYVANATLAESRESRETDIESIHTTTDSTMDGKILVGGAGNLITSGLAFWISADIIGKVLDAVRPKGRSQE